MIKMDGLLLVDKPKGWTSFDVVAKVRGILRADARAKGTPGKIKVGHTGTLDPMATGLLVLAIGKYTKKVPELTKKDKIYECFVTLGATSTTDDAEGTLQTFSTSKPSLGQLKSELAGFVGEIQQVPPQFSAIKVGGVRSYAVARRGDIVKLEPRTVTIYSISDIKYDYPKVSFVAHVGSGTYIRSIARDVGQKLVVGAYLSDLRRIKVGDFLISDAVDVSDINYELIAKNTIALK